MYKDIFHNSSERGRDILSSSHCNITYNITVLKITHLFL